MSAPAVHLKGFGLDPSFSLELQIASIEGEIEACHVFLAAAESDLAAHDVRALARIAALSRHEYDLQGELYRLNHLADTQNHH